MDKSTDDDHDPDDSCVLPIVSLKEVFQAVVTLNNYLVQHEKKYTKRDVYIAKN